MYHREYPITPTQQAANGALDIFIEGQRKALAPQMLFGLSVLLYATEAQVQTAIAVVAQNQHVEPAAIAAMLAA